MLFMAGLLILPIVSCNRAELDTIDEPAGEGVQLVVKAVIGDNDDTRTAIQSDGTSIYWTEGDAINLFYGDMSSGQFTTDLTEPSASATFYGSIGVATGTTESGASSRAFWGVYPYNAANTCDGSSVTLTIPGEQSGVAGTFADKLNPTVATSPGLDLAFYNVASWFKFSVAAGDIVSATFRGGQSESVVGTVRVGMENARPVVTEVVSGVTSITMTPLGSGSFIPGQEYYMVVIPQTFSNGYSLTLTKSDGSTATWSTTGTKTFTRSQFRGKLNADSGLTFVLPEPEAVDLGLPSGIKWASLNLGAGLPEGRGHYYAWGETETYYSYFDFDNPSSVTSKWNYGKSNGYNWMSYKWASGVTSPYASTPTLTKYNWDSQRGVVDSKTVLDLEDDVAHDRLGDKWRIPRSEEWQELVDNCTWTATTRNGINGFEVSGNGNSIFLASNSGYFNSQTNFITSGMAYGSSSLRFMPTWHCGFRTSSSSYGVQQQDGRTVGAAIRPVYGDVIHPESVALNKSTLSLAVNGHESLEATVSPSNATTKDVVWASSNPSVAAVLIYDGYVSAVAPGEATITATTGDGQLTASCIVTVTE